MPDNAESRGPIAHGSCRGDIPRHECLRLITTAIVGRVIYTRQALPAVDLVKFAVHEGDIVITTQASGSLATAISGAIVAFEVDALDPSRMRGWSVTAIGRSRDVSDPAETDRLRRIGLSSWAPDEYPHFIRIPPEIVQGRKLGPDT